MLTDWLKARTQRDINEWRRNNSVLRRERYRGYEYTAAELAARPVSAVVAALLVLLSLSVLASDSVLLAVRHYFWPDVLGFETYGDDGRSGIESALLALWATQATLAGLVYPIVLSFVTVLLQRSSGPSAVRVYLHYTAAKLVGLSSLGLLLGISVQILFELFRYEWLSNRQLALWFSFDVAWFCLNLIFIAIFLSRTLRFLSAERRLAETRKYVLGYVWPSRVRSGLNAHMFERANALLGLKDDNPLDDSNEPRVRFHSWWRGEGSQPEVGRTFDRRVMLDDVGLHLLRLAIAGWRRRSLKRRSGETADVLRFPLAPGAVYEGRTSIAETEGRTRLSLIEYWLIRFAFRFSAEIVDADDDESFYVRDLIQECISEMRSGNEAALRRTFFSVMDLHGRLLRGSEFKADDGAFYSYATLETGWGRGRHHEWVRCYDPLIREAIRNISSGSTSAFDLVCYTPRRALDLLDDARVVDLRDSLILFLPFVAHRLAEWWRDEAGKQALGHGLCQPITLPPPLGSMHLRALRDWLGNWESLKDQFFPESEVEDYWLDAQRWVHAYSTHLAETCALVLFAVSQGDRAAAEHLGDSLQKWGNRLDFKFGHRTFGLRRESLITVDDLLRPWDDVRADFVEDFARDNDLWRPVVRAGLHNLWIDFRCVVTYQLLIWARECQCESSLAAELSAGLVSGIGWLAGEDGNQSALATSGPDLLGHVLRQRLGGPGRSYQARLDSFCEKIAAFRDGDWIPGRVYSRSGSSDLDSLSLGAALLLMVMSDHQWSGVDNLASEVRSWLSDSERIQHVEALIARYAQVTSHIEDESSKSAFACVSTKLDKEPSFADAKVNLQSALEELRSYLADRAQETLDAAQISPLRLADYEGYASSVAFSRETGGFPLALFPQLYQEPAGHASKKSLTLKALEKGLFTVPPMAQRPSNEADWVARAMREHVGAMTLAEVLRRLPVVEVDAIGPGKFWRQFTLASRALMDQGLTPLLMVDNATRPTWIWEWLHPEVGQQRYPRPEGFRQGDINGWPAQEELAGVVNDVPVYQAPISTGASWLVAKEAFGELVFGVSESGGHVTAKAIEASGSKNTLDLRLEWVLRVSGPKHQAWKLRYAAAKPSQPAAPK
jgi:hypothetical protein